MTIQIVNTKLKRGNIIRTKKSNIFKILKERGWNAVDCTFKEIEDELINTRYVSADGVNTITTQR